MLGNGLGFTPKKAQFWHVENNGNRVIIQCKYCTGVPTNFDEDCLRECLKKSSEIRFLLRK